MSYLTHLECPSCLRQFPFDQVQTFCLNCRSPLLARYDLESARKLLDKNILRCREPGMWRWREFLPVFEQENITSLGEGDTPLLKLPHLSRDLKIENVYLKDESQNPTGTFKARGLSAAISKAKELGVKKVIIPTAGNAGGAMAAYAARAGLEAFILMPKDSPFSNIEESRIAGAEVVLINGLISDAAVLADEKARTEGWFDVSTFKEPYRCEGKKVMGFELAESFGWTLPDVIIYPTGGGTGLVGMWKAFSELETLGWLESNTRPRMVAVQSSGCAPVVKAFQSGSAICDFWQDAETIAFGLKVPKSFADRLILQNLHESLGTAIAVSDNEITEAQKQLASREGVFASPEGAATLAGLIKLAGSGFIKPGEKIVLFNTGTGLKYITPPKL